MCVHCTPCVSMYCISASLVSMFYLLFSVSHVPLTGNTVPCMCTLVLSPFHCLFARNKCHVYTVQKELYVSSFHGIRRKFYVMALCCIPTRICIRNVNSIWHPSAYMASVTGQDLESSYSKISIVNFVLFYQPINYDSTHNCVLNHLKLDKVGVYMPFFLGLNWAYLSLNMSSSRTENFRWQ